MTSNATPPAPPSYYIDGTNKQSGKFYHPLVLGRIFALLVGMINILQVTAAEQAKRLNFLSNWQKAYTDKMNQLHSFVSNNGDATARYVWTPSSLDNAGNESATKIRGDLNSANTQYSQLLQGNRQLISDDAKALQSNINQTNDAVQSQTDMATSILQQLATILGSIFQG